MALIGAAIIVLAKGGMAADITVHEPDGQARVFVDVVGQINDEDFKTFKEKTDQIYPIGPDHPNKQVIVTLISHGGHVKAGPDRRSDTQKGYVHLRPRRSHVYQRVRTDLACRTATKRR